MGLSILLSCASWIAACSTVVWSCCWEEEALAVEQARKSAETRLSRVFSMDAGLMSLSLVHFEK